MGFKNWIKVTGNKHSQCVKQSRSIQFLTFKLPVFLLYGNDKKYLPKKFYSCF